MQNTDNAQTVSDYWSRQGLGQTILDALAAAGIGLDALTVEDSAPVGCTWCCRFSRDVLPQSGAKAYALYDTGISRDHGRSRPTACLSGDVGAR